MKDYLQNFDFHKIDEEAPLEEPARQNYYIGIVRDMLIPGIISLRQSP